MEQEFGRIKKSKTKEVVIQIDEYNGSEGITIREFVNGQRFHGFTKRGVRIPIENWSEFKSIIDRIN